MLRILRIYSLCVLTLILHRVDSYIKAEDPLNFPEVLRTMLASTMILFGSSKWPARLREPKADTELAYAYVKTNRLHDMEDFLNMTNIADILEVGEKCFEDELYQAAKLLYSSILNWARLATSHLSW